jgi:hypothetical protein
MSKPFQFAWLVVVAEPVEVELAHQRQVGMVEILPLARHF